MRSYWRPTGFRRSISYFWLPKPWDNKFVILTHSVCNGSPRNQIPSDVTVLAYYRGKRRPRNPKHCLKIPSLLRVPNQADTKPYVLHHMLQCLQAFRQLSKLEFHNMTWGVHDFETHKQLILMKQLTPHVFYQKKKKNDLVWRITTQPPNWILLTCIYWTPIICFFRYCSRKLPSKVFQWIGKAYMQN